MTTILVGDRIGRQGKLRLGCSATLFDGQRKKVLLTRRTDNGLWCLPGGTPEPGETIAAACQREVFEETGLRVRVVRLIGVYSEPDQLVIYPDGNAFQIVVINFEVEVTGGEPGLSSETTEIGYFSLDEIEGMQLFHNHHLHIKDAFAAQEAAIFR